MKNSVQWGPAIWWLATLEHLREKRVWIRIAAGRAQASFVVHPGENDDLRSRVVAKEESKSTPDLGPSPVAKGYSKCIDLPIGIIGRIVRYDIENQMAECTQKLDVGVVGITMRI